MHFMSQSDPLHYVLEKEHNGIRQRKIKEKIVPIIGAVVTTPLI